MDLAVVVERARGGERKGECVPGSQWPRVERPAVGGNGVGHGSVVHPADLLPRLPAADGDAQCDRAELEVLDRDRRRLLGVHHSRRRQRQQGGQRDNHSGCPHGFPSSHLRQILVPSVGGSRNMPVTAKRGEPLGTVRKGPRYTPSGCVTSREKASAASRTTAARAAASAPASWGRRSQPTVRASFW